MSISEAAELARTRLFEVMPTYSGNDTQLEELETPPHGSKWRFTFSIFDPTVSNASLAAALRPRRVTKVVEIDSATGELLAIRNAAA